MPWWHRETFGRRLPGLQARARIKQAVRQFFFDRGIVEVETPALQRSPGNETHISAFRTNAIGDDGRSHPFALHSSPEFACKKLLAAGLPALFTLAPVFRNRERGRLHHPEFWMLEWYRAEAPLATLMEDCVGLLRAATAATSLHSSTRGSLSLASGRRSTHADPFAESEIISVVDAFHRHAGIDLETMLPDAPGGLKRLADAARGVGQRVAADDTWSDLFSKILSARIEPELGIGRPTFLTRYPASEAALARLCTDDPRFAERFELYCCGVELANAFDELTDAAEQRRRFEAAEAERRRIYGESYPLDEDFLAALPRMPQTVGIALGFDRLVMLATGAEHIEDVLWVPVAEVTS